MTLCEQGVCKNHYAVILNQGFRWARATRHWVHLTRDDHASLAMYQARAQRALVQGNIKRSSLADRRILTRMKGENTPLMR